MGQSSWAQTLVRHSRRQVLNLFLTQGCPLCQRPATTSLCSTCCRQVRQCQSDRPWDTHPSGLTVFSWGHYDSGLRQAIRSLKYSGHTDIAQFLGVELGQTWQNHPGPIPRGPVAIVPIPLHHSKFQQRGFNQAELLARAFCRQTRLPLYAGALVRTQATQAQHSLDRMARQRNLAQAFAVSAAQVQVLRSQTVWLLDDIFTTGATAQAAAAALRQSGVTVGGICAVARAVAHQP